MSIKRVVPKEEVAEHHSDILLFLEALRISDVVFIEDDAGTWRFRENQLICLLQEACKTQYDMNRLCELAGRNFRLREYVKFYMDIGYSLGGFEEIFGDAMDSVLGILRDPATGEEKKRGEELVSLSKHYDEHIESIDTPASLLWKDPITSPPEYGQECLVEIQLRDKEVIRGLGSRVQGDENKFPGLTWGSDYWYIMHYGGLSTNCVLRYTEIPKSVIEEEVAK